MWFKVIEESFILTKLLKCPLYKRLVIILEH